MKTWQSKLIEQFIPDLDPMSWVVADPDGIVRTEKVLAALVERGFDVVYFDDPIAFRYEYESRIRRSWERGNRHPLVVVHEPDAQLPSDLLQLSHRKAFGLNDLFQNLDADVLRSLPAEWWGVLQVQAQRHPGKTFTASETEELALRVCCKLVPDLIDTDVELMRKLIELHRLGLQIPERLCRRVERDFSTLGVFQDWPVFDLLRDQQTLWAFLQERWLSYLHQQGMLGDDLPTLKIPGPRKIPFDSPALQVYWDNLFAEGSLKVIDCGHKSVTPAAWWRVGVLCEQIVTSFKIGRLSELVDVLPETGSSYKDWIKFGLKYSRVVADLFKDDNKVAIQSFWDDVWPAVDDRFSAWVKDGYLGLYNLPTAPPKMVHHIPKQLLRWHKDGEKVALVVLDGLSCAGWYGLRKGLLSDTEACLDVEESATFAWLPSLTPVSRQALYSGLPPMLFPETMSRTDKDAKRWAEFWESSASLLPKNISHQLMKGTTQDLNMLPDFESEPIKVYGATISMPDELMHGVKLGWRALNEQLAVWEESGFLQKYINRLLDSGFKVCLTADHGNVEAVGAGKILDGVLAERRGQRIRIYKNESLRDNAQAMIGEAGFGWDSSLLPEGNYPLYASGRAAFVGPHDTIVSHGGASLDELLVPWVTIKRKS